MEKKFQLLRFSLTEVISLSARGLFPFPAKITKQWDLLRLMALSVSILYQCTERPGKRHPGPAECSPPPLTDLLLSDLPLFTHLLFISLSPLFRPRHSLDCIPLPVLCSYYERPSLQTTPSPTPSKAWLICDLVATLTTLFGG